MGEPIYARTETIAGCPKYCPVCGNQGLCVDSRRSSEAVTRRYKCQCGRKWSTVELMVEDDRDYARGGKIQRFRHAQQRKAIAALRNELNTVITKFFDAQSEPEGHDNAKFK